MPQACWKADPDGYYWIDVFLGSHPLPMMLDSGLVDPAGLVGFSMEPTLYDRTKQAGEFHQMAQASRLDASGGVSTTECGLVIARLQCPTTHQPVGPGVQVYVLRGAPGVHSRVGVAFFHHLTGCH